MAEEAKHTEPTIGVASVREEPSASGQNIPIWKQNDASTILGVSVRAWIATLVIATVCYMSVRETVVKEPLYTLAGLVVGFYFGQSPKKAT